MRERLKDSNVKDYISDRKGVNQEHGGIITNIITLYI